MVPALRLWKQSPSIHRRRLHGESSRVLPSPPFNCATYTRTPYTSVKPLHSVVAHFTAKMAGTQMRCVLTAFRTALLAASSCPHNSSARCSNSRPPADQTCKWIGAGRLLAARPSRPCAALSVAGMFWNPTLRLVRCAGDTVPQSIVACTSGSQHGMSLAVSACV